MISLFLSICISFSIAPQLRKTLSAAEQSCATSLDVKRISSELTFSYHWFQLELILFSFDFMCFVSFSPIKITVKLKKTNWAYNSREEGKELLQPKQEKWFWPKDVNFFSLRMYDWGKPRRKITQKQWVVKWWGTQCDSMFYCSNIFFLFIL